MEARLAGYCRSFNSEISGVQWVAAAYSYIVIRRV